MAALNESLSNAVGGSSVFEELFDYEDQDDEDLESDGGEWQLETCDDEDMVYDWIPQPASHKRKSPFPDNASINTIASVKEEIGEDPETAEGNSCPTTYTFYTNDGLQEDFEQEPKRFKTEVNEAAAVEANGEMTETGGNEERRGTGRGNKGGSGGSKAASTAQAYGKRFQQVYITDEDVPKELSDIIMKAQDQFEDAQDSDKLRQRRNARRDVTDEDDYFMVDDVGDAALFGSDDSASHFEWSPMASFKGVKEDFVPKKTGATVLAETAYDAFRAYWDDSILSHIVTETNKYAASIKIHTPNFKWSDTNVDEILVLFSFWMMLGIIRMPTKKSCFSLHPLYKSEIFRSMFSKHRYENLCRALQFVDNSSDQYRTNDSLFFFGPVLNHLNAKFMECYVPSQNVYIRENLKPRSGIKFFEVCESTTHYLWSFFLQCEKETQHYKSIQKTLLHSTATVIKLMQPLFNKGYTLHMDKSFNSPILARYLKRNGTDCVGTLRANRRNVPPIVALSKLQTGQMVARHSGDLTVMAYQDKTKVIAISTFHGVDLGLTRANPDTSRQWKPLLILDYNKGLNGVDRKNLMLEPYSIVRKGCMTWCMKFLKRLLDCSVQNAKILYECRTDTSQDFISFKLELVEQILSKHQSSFVSQPREAPARSSSSHYDGIRATSRLTESTHWPVILPHPRPAEARRRLPRRRCVWCSVRLKKQSRTNYRCMTCEAPLCLDPCFRLYHTVA